MHIRHPDTPSVCQLLRYIHDAASVQSHPCCALVCARSSLMQTISCGMVPLGSAGRCPVIVPSLFFVATLPPPPRSVQKFAGKIEFCQRKQSLAIFGTQTLDLRPPLPP